MATKTETFKCSNCKGDVVLEMPMYEIVNTMFSSLIIFSHPNPDVCNHCGQAYTFALDKNPEHAPRVSSGWVPVQLEPAQARSSGVIELPTGANWKELLNKKGN